MTSTNTFCLHVSLGDVRGWTCPYVLANLASRGSIKLGVLHKKHGRYLALNISKVNTWRYTCKKSWLMPEVAIRIPNSEKLRLVSRIRGVQVMRIAVEVKRSTRKRTRVQETRLLEIRNFPLGNICTAYYLLIKKRRIVA